MSENSQGMNRNTIYNTIRSISSIIYPLISFLYVARTLMTENMGKINFGNSIVNYCSLIASLGVTTYAVRECSKVREDKEKLGELSSQILSINVLSTGLAYLILAILLLFAKPLENYRLLICVQCSSILFTTIGAEWLNTAMEDFRFVAIRTVVIQILSLILLFIFVKKPEDYITYAALTVIASSGSGLINTIYRRRYCKTRFTFHLNAKKHLPSIMLLFSLIISQTIYVNSDITILGLMKGDYQVGLYGTAVSIYTLVNTTVASITWVVMPKLSAAFVKKDYEEINAHLKYALNYILCLGLPCICGIEMLSPHLITMIAGEAYIGGALSLRILGAALLCSFFGGWIANMMLIPAGKEKVCLRSSVICAVVNIVLNLILIPKWGLNAAAMTTVVAELTGVLILRCSVDKDVRIDGIKQMIPGPLLGCVGIIAVSFLSLKLLHNPNLICIAAIAGSVLVYCVIMIITKNEFFLDFVKPIIRRVKGGKQVP